MTYIETNGLHSAPDEMASEYETYDFLYGLVRLLKPTAILETGCYMGGATKALANAVKDNGIGGVSTCDINHEYTKLTREICSGLPVVAVTMEGEKVCANGNFWDLAFLDSSGDRVAECAALNLSPKGVVVLHDSKREQYKPIWTMRPWASIWEIDTPRGLTVFQS